MPERPGVRHLVFLLLVVGGCVDVTDLRIDPRADIPTGQVDTGYVPDVFAPDLPTQQSCGTEADCVDWLGDAACLIARCTNAICDAEPSQEGSPCSDGDFTTHGDSCKSGVCQPGPGVCVCDSDPQCDTFDDGNPCNGRLSCDGCACLPMATPPGTACDDLNPATTGDQCMDSETCLGTVPCQCETRDDCAKLQCQEPVCADCQCAVFPAVAGLLYREDRFDFGIPQDWDVESSSTEVTWRAGGGRIVANGPDGTYDYGPAEATLRSPPLTLPPGGAVLQADVGLLSAEEGCGDRLEIGVDDVLLDTLCGPTEVKTRTWAITSDATVRLIAVFVSNDAQNSAAGAIIDNVRFIRTEPDECTAPPSWEAVVPSATAGEQVRPDITPMDDGYRVVWVDGGGLRSRLLDSGGAAVGDDVVIDAEGAAPDAAESWLVWERKGAIVVQEAGQTATVIADEGVADAPAIAADGSAIAYLVETGGGTLLRGRAAPFDTALDLAGVEQAPGPPRMAVDSQGAWLLYSTVNGVRLLAPGTVQPEALSNTPASSRPALATGFNRRVAVFTSADSASVEIRSKSNVLSIPATGAVEPAVSADAGGWFVVWTSVGGADSGLVGVRLTPDASLVSPLMNPINAYTFGDQDSVQLAPMGDSALAVWRTDWMDGDPSGVVRRRLDPAIELSE